MYVLLTVRMASVLLRAREIHSLAHMVVILTIQPDVVFRENALQGQTTRMEKDPYGYCWVTFIVHVAFPPTCAPTSKSPDFTWTVSEPCAGHFTAFLHTIAEFSVFIKTSCTLAPPFALA